VRLEVGIREGEDTDWRPIRFYTTNIIAPAYNNSFVELDPSNVSVTAQALMYNSSLPLKLVNATTYLSIREYLCGEYVDTLQDNSHDVRLRWMQRFGTLAERNFVPWIIGNVKIRLWNGSCFSELVNNNFSSAEDIHGLDVRTGSVATCNVLPDMKSALHFSESVTMSGLTRRSVTIDLTNRSSRCVEESQTSCKLVLQYFQKVLC